MIGRRGLLVATGVSLAGQMSEIYRFGCWVTGSGMVLVAVLSALRAGSRHAAPALPGDLTRAHQR